MFAIKILIRIDQGLSLECENPQDFHVKLPELLCSDHHYFFQQGPVMY